MTLGATAEITQRDRQDADLVADDEMKMNALWRWCRRGLEWRSVPVRTSSSGCERTSAGGKVRRVIQIQQGIPIGSRSRIVKYLKEQKLKKVQASIQPIRFASAPRKTSPGGDAHAPGA